MKTKILVLILGLLLVLTPLACTTNPTVLDGTDWILTELNDHSTFVGTIVTLKFSEGKISGRDGCNRYNGTYTLSGNKIRLKNIFATLMSCPPKGVNEQAEEYHSVLLATAQYEINGDKLSLLDKHDIMLATFTDQSQELARTSWIVTGFNNGEQIVVSPLSDVELTVTFDADGKVRGNAGCNQYAALYTTENQYISIDSIEVTRMFCSKPDEIMQQETQFLAALQSAVSYKFDGESLEVYRPVNVIALILVKAP